MTMASASTWVKFFSSAGIPAPANATYAHIFVKNRIAQDMLTELNKEYLREMGISAMGDIISILRHSKAVTEQAARDDIMAENEKTKIIAKIAPASIPSSKKVSTQIIVPRRVLPEHEGKYKVSLPKGSTKKTREILAKHSLLQSDKMDKKSIFDRLNSKDVEMTSTANESRVKPSVKTTSSIFNRLGSYKELDKKNGGSGILKPSVRLGGVVKQRIANPVITKPVVHRIIEAGECSSESNDSDDCKQVSFSPEVQVRTFRAQPVIVSPKKTIKITKSVAIKSRLGKNGDEVPSAQYLHAIRKKVSMKPVKTSPVSRGSKMKSDTMTSHTKTIHSRLDTKSRGLSTRVGNLTLSTKSVFNRLGKNE